MEAGDTFVMGAESAGNEKARDAPVGETKGLSCPCFLAAAIAMGPRSLSGPLIPSPRPLKCIF